MMLGSHDRSAAAKQQNGTEPGKMQHLMWVRWDEAFADVEKVGDNEDGEKGRLGQDNKDHCNLPR